MPKPTKTQIDAEIIDRAAALFARHGFTQTSLQQIADAVNYSKAGLLHHYSSKKAIYEAAIRTCTDAMRSLLAEVEELPVGAARDRIVLESLLSFTFEWPGISVLGNRFIGGPDENSDLDEAGLVMLAAVGIDPETSDEARIVRVTSAFAGLGIAALAAIRADMKREWRPHIVAAAYDALGHAKPIG